MIYRDVQIRKIVRLAQTLREMLNPDSSDDLEEFLTNIERSFLLISEYLHNQVDENETYENSQDVLKAHQLVDDLYKQIMSSVVQNQTSLAFNNSSNWANTSLSTISLKIEEETEKHQES